MRRLVPYPLLTLGLLAMWLVLNDSASAGHVAIGLLMGLVAGVVYARLEPPRGKAARLLVPSAMLVWLVLVDIVCSNLAVLRIVSGLRGRGRTAGFLAIPLQLRDPRGLAVLAAIVTATPGTSWAHHDAAANVLTLHVLDLADDENWVRQFKDRYERRLMEIFP
jgi:multicomponent K+:H+ antiporter subunit E